MISLGYANLTLQSLICCLYISFCSQISFLAFGSRFAFKCFQWNLQKMRSSFFHTSLFSIIIFVLITLGSSGFFLIHISIFLTVLQGVHYSDFWINDVQLSSFMKVNFFCKFQNYQTKYSRILGIDCYILLVLSFYLSAFYASNISLLRDRTYDFCSCIFCIFLPTSDLISLFRFSNTSYVKLILLRKRYISIWIVYSWALTHFEVIWGLLSSSPWVLDYIWDVS